MPQLRNVTEVTPTYQRLPFPLPVHRLRLTPPNENRSMNSTQAHQVPRSAAVVGLFGIALIHLLELQSKLKEVPYLGVGYIVLVLASLIAAAMLVHRNSRLGWAMAGGAALATITGFVLTRTVGLPLSTDDIGNWLEPMGLASLLVEGSVVALAAYALLTKPVTATGQLPSHRESSTIKNSVALS